MSDLQFRVLGPVALLRDNRPVSLGGGTMLALLASLMTAPNRSVPVCQIIEWVWHGTLPDGPATRSLAAIIPHVLPR